MVTWDYMFSCGPSSENLVACFRMKKETNKEFAAIWSPVWDELDRMGYSQTRVALELTKNYGTKIRQQQVSKWGNPKGYKPKNPQNVINYLKTIENFPYALIAPIEAFFGGSIIPLDSRRTVEHGSSPGAPKSGRKLPETAVIARGVEDLPLRKVVRDLGSGDTALLNLSGAVVERPSNLLDAREAYAFKYVGSDMHPRHKQGELLHVTPVEPGDITAGDSVVVYLKGATEGSRFVVREYLSEGKEGICVRAAAGDAYIIAWTDYEDMHLVTGSLYKV